MANKTGALAMKSIIKRLEDSVKESISRAALVNVGVFATELIVKRTRLGYGVDESLGKKAKLAPLSQKYIKSRKMFDGLSELTTPKRSNLTRTSQMLYSIRSVVKGNTVKIEPSGTRDDGKRNKDIARYNQEGGRGRPKRIFMNLSSLEFKQTVRFYRKTFGDLLRKRNVIK